MISRRNAIKSGMALAAGAALLPATARADDSELLDFVKYLARPAGEKEIVGRYFERIQIAGQLRKILNIQGCEKEDSKIEEVRAWLWAEA